MNILFYLDTLGVSGGEIWIADTAGKLQKKGHNVFIGCPSGSWMAHQSEAQEIPYFDYLIGEEFEGHLLWQLVECLQEEHIDLICCGIPGVREEVPLLDRAIREAGCGRILLRLGVAPGAGALSPERIGLGFETVCGIVAVSRDIKRRLLEEFPELPPDRIHMIHNGVDMDRFSPSDFLSADGRRLRASLGIPQHHRIVGTVGRLDPIKNLPMFIRAATSILAKHPDTTFLVAGTGGEKRGLNDAAREAGVLDNFCFAGFIENIPALLHAIDILVHTSLSEGVPNAVLEAMAMGKPVIATDVGGVSELIETEETGILVPSDDDLGLAAEVCGMLRHPQRAAALGQNARRHVESTFDRRVKFAEIESLFISEANRARAACLHMPRAAPEFVGLPANLFPHVCSLQKLSA